MHWLSIAILQAISTYITSVSIILKMQFQYEKVIYWFLLRLAFSMWEWFLVTGTVSAGEEKPTLKLKNV